jgi:LCP family protein required for cell wall assembly
VQRFSILFFIVVLLFSALSAALLAYAKDTVSSIPRTAFGNILTQDKPADQLEQAIVDSSDSSSVLDDSPRETLNFFIIGTDSVDTLPVGHRLRGSRSSAQLLTDTLIILRLETGGGSSDASVVSIPRDLWVPISGYGGEHQKINSLLAFTGPQTLVQTVKDYFAIPIHYVINVDFNGFLELFKLVGGLDIFVEFPLKDKKAHLSIQETGCVSLTPEQGLGLVRSRTLEAFIDGQWRLIDATSDLGRMDRQQDFLVHALQQAFDSGFRNPVKIKDLVVEVFRGGFLTLDDQMTPENMIDLASSFRDFDANELNKYTLPTVFDWDGPYSILRLVESEAQLVLDVFRGDQTEKSFGIVLLNGTGVTGEASRIAEELTDAGFRVTETGNAPSFDIERTSVFFDAVQVESALLLASHLVSGADLVQREEDTGLSIEMIFGRDYDGVSNTPIEPDYQQENALELYIQPENEKNLGRYQWGGQVSPQLYDSVVLTSTFLSAGKVTMDSSGDGEDETQIQDALLRAGQIRSC